MLKKVPFLLLMMVLVAFFTACDPYQPVIPTTSGRPSEPTTTPSAVVTDPTEPSAAPEPSTALPTVPATTVAPTAHVHSYVASPVAPGCLEPGYMLHTCSCGDYFEDQHVDPLGHDWSDWSVAVEPTESLEGQKLRTCHRCGCEDVQVLPPIPPAHTHSYTAQTVAPTCTQPGYTSYLCACGDHYQDQPVDALGHAWSDWQVVTEPTVETEGLQQRYCSRCSASDSSTIEKLSPPHTHDYRKEKVAATCTEGGYTRYLCACGEYYDEQTSQPKGHTWENWTVSVLPTHLQEGQRRRLCSVCGEAEVEMLDFLPYEGAFVIVTWPETIGRNMVGTVIILGTPGVEYDIDVYYKSGASSAKGLENQIADENGYVIWTWKVGPSTAAGTYRIVISGGDQEQTVMFTVVVE